MTDPAPPPSEHISNLPERLAQLAREGAACAVATVVARRAPVSAQVGDKAIIHADGRMEGFVGGACSREVVRRQGLLALASGQARLVSIRPGATPEGADHPYAERVTVPMNCASEGESEVFVEPLLPPRLLIVVGFTPVARAIAEHATLAGERVWRVLDDGEAADVDGSVPLSALAQRLATLPEGQRASLRAVVASQGHYDESALEVLLRAQPAFVGLLASRKRAATVRETLAALSGFTEAELAAIHAPVGLDLGARTPQEVAVSVLAQLVQLGRGHGKHPPAPSPAPVAVDHTPLTVLPVVMAPAPGAGEATDPVCGMSVTVATAQHSAELDGQTYYFCCPHCKARFVKDPHKYLAGSGA